MKAPSIEAFNQEKAVVGIVKTSTRRGVAADCSGRGNEERISRTAKMLLGMWQTAIHRSPRSARGGDGAHDANMNKDWSKE